MQLVAAGDSLDGADFRALRLKRRHEATVDERAIEFDRASAALALAATFFRAGEAGLFAQHVEQARHWKCFEGYRATVYFTLHTNLAHGLRHARSPELRGELRA